MTETNIGKKYYKEQALKWGDSASFAMEDEIVKDREVELISNFINILKGENLRTADIGCGNGYALNILSTKFPNNIYTGTDISQELLNIAEDRKLANCDFYKDDIRSSTSIDCYYDAVYTERCLINIPTWEEQKKALNEIHRILKPGGHYLMIECFTDGLANNNKARVECGLPALKEVPFNKFFDKELFFEAVEDKFDIK